MNRLPHLGIWQKRARRLAKTFPDGLDQTRLLRYADELEGQAADLETSAEPKGPKSK
jgi:hypothetical protein